jgi:hypothetical protein
MSLSDAICRLATGGGFSTRELYSDSDEILFNVMRPVIINGIEEIISRGDLLDRTIILSLPRIEKKKRRKEKEFWAKFEEAKPRILGALYDAVSGVLRELPSTVVEEPPRMADYAYIGTAAEKVFGLEPGSFMRAYDELKQGANDLVLEAEPVAQVTCAFIREQGEWSGKASDLLKELNSKADEKTQRLKSWPTDGSKLSNVLRRLAPNLVPVGVFVDFQRVGHKRTRTIFLRYVEPASAPSAMTITIDDSETNVRTAPDEVSVDAPAAPPSADNYSQTNRIADADSADGDLVGLSNEAVRLGPATWRNKDYDAPITIIGDAGLGPDGRRYARIAEGTTAIPLDEVVYPAPAMSECPTCGEEGIRFGVCATCDDFIR